MNLALLNLALLSLVSVVIAQRASIGFPLDGASISAGSDITVELDRAVSFISLSSFLKSLNLSAELSVKLTRSGSRDRN